MSCDLPLVNGIKALLFQIFTFGKSKLKSRKSKVKSGNANVNYPCIEL